MDCQNQNFGKLGKTSRNNGVKNFSLVETLKNERLSDVDWKCDRIRCPTTPLTPVFPVGRPISHLKRFAQLRLPRKQRSLEKTRPVRIRAGRWRCRGGIGPDCAPRRCRERACGSWPGNRSPGGPRWAAPDSHRFATCSVRRKVDAGRKGRPGGPPALPVVRTRPIKQH